MFCSILISNYNKEKYLEECLSSCVNQDYKNYEILIGDNGSKDKSLEIINSFKNIKLFKIEKKFVGQNVRVPGVEKFEGIVSRSNYSEYFTDLSPAFNFKKLEELI